jgi:hypothetical protein
MTHLLTKISRAILLGIAGVSAAGLAYLLLPRNLHVSAPAAVAIAAGMLLGATGVFGYLAFALSDRAIKLVARELVVAGASLLLLDLAITVFAPDTPNVQLKRKRVAEKLGVPFDARSKTEVVSALREQGIDAYPGMSREWPRLELVRQQLPEGLFPLAQVANATIVECNESGRYLVYDSDEIGFNNPRGIYSSGNVDIAAVGASFTLGHCVPREDSLVGLIRRSYPRTLTVGMAGSGALSILGSLREYVAPLKPKMVLWIMHPWIADTAEEMQDSILRQYLQRGFTQGLLARRDAIDRTWREIAISIQYEFDRRNRDVVRHALANRWAGVLSLSHLRAKLPLATLLRRPDPPPDVAPFLSIIRSARAEVEGWGGTFVVMIMPMYAEIVAHQIPETLRSERLAATLRGLGMHVVDCAELFERQPDPEGLYTMRSAGHPNPTGYALMGDYVVSDLKAHYPGMQAAH